MKKKTKYSVFLSSHRNTENCCAVEKNYAKKIIFMHGSVSGKHLS